MSTSVAQDGQTGQGRRYRAYLLTMLATIYGFNCVDRVALGLLLQDIKTDLHLSDTQLGLMTGIAFAAFYSVMGIPIARWADRGNRVTVVAVTTALWGITLALSGTARTFGQLLVIRVGVAIGESGCVPVAHSLIADYYPRSERPRAVALFLLGGSASYLIGYFLAGWLDAWYGWRATFFWLGLPGLPLAALAWLSMREPREQCKRSPPTEGGARLMAPADPTMREVFFTVWRVPAFRHLLFCISVAFFFTYGINKWQPTFFIRSYGMPISQVGTWFGLILGTGGILGTFLSGEWASRFAPRNERRQLRILALIFVALCPIAAAVYVVPSRSLAFASMAIGGLGVACTYGPLFGTIPMIVPAQMRAMAIALIYLVANLVGLGLGPLAVGAVSDALGPRFGVESLRYALMIMTPGFLWGAWHLWRASRHVARAIAEVEDMRAIRSLPAGSR